MWDSIVAENTKRILAERGLCLKIAAELAGYEAASFNDLLTGREPITDRDIIALSDAFGVEPNELFAS